VLIYCGGGLEEEAWGVIQHCERGSGLGDLTFVESRAYGLSPWGSPGYVGGVGSLQPVHLVVGGVSRRIAFLFFLCKGCYKRDREGTCRWGEFCP